MVRINKSFRKGGMIQSIKNSYMKPRMRTLSNVQGPKTSATSRFLNTSQRKMTNSVHKSFYKGTLRQNATKLISSIPSIPSKLGSVMPSKSSISSITSKLPSTTNVTRKLGSVMPSKASISSITSKLPSTTNVTRKLGSVIPSKSSISSITSKLPSTTNVTRKLGSVMPKAPNTKGLTSSASSLIRSVFK
jgi:hypothetical protein